MRLISNRFQRALDAEPRRSRARLILVISPPEHSRSRERLVAQIRVGLVFAAVVALTVAISQ